jgi:hypothetical protein
LSFLHVIKPKIKHLLSCRIEKEYLTEIIRDADDETTYHTPYIKNQLQQVIIDTSSNKRSFSNLDKIFWNESILVSNQLKPEDMELLDSLNENLRTVFLN